MPRRRPKPLRRGTTVTLGAVVALAASGALAQQAPEAAAEGQTTLPTLTVSTEADQGMFGPTFAESAGGVMKTDTPILETPRSVSVVTQQQIQDRGARSLTDALQYTPGVFSASGGNDNRGDWTKIRGFDPTIFLDGMQSYFGYYNNGRPDPFLFDSIAVLKGPSAMLYGNASAGGIINEVSKLPDPLAPNIVQLQVGSNNLFQSAIDMGGEFGDGKFLYRLVGLGRSADGPINYSKDDAAAFMPSLTWAPSDATKLTVLGFYQKNDTSPYIQFLSPYGTLWSAEDFANGDFLPNDVFVGEPDANSYDTTRKAVSLFGEHRFNGVWGIGGSLRYTASTADYSQLWWAYDNYGTGRYNPDGTINRSGEIAHNDSHSWIGDLHGTADFALGATRHAVMFGAGFTDGRHNYDYGPVYQNGPIDPFNPVYTGVTRAPDEFVDNPEMKLRQKSIYAQDLITFREKLHLNVGLRYDWIDTDAETWEADASQSLSDGQLSPSIALLYAMDNGLSPYLSYSESFIQEAFGTDAAGNAFAPTQGKQYEAGVKYQPAGTDMLLTAAVFDLTKSNMLVPNPDNPNFSIQNGEAKSRGIELGAQGNWRGFTLDAAYTYLDTEGVDGDRLSGVPQNQASAWLQYAFSGVLQGLEAGFGARYVGATFTPATDFTPLVKTPDVTLFDAMLAYQWDGYRVALTGRNLADKTYTVDCSFYNCYYGDPRIIGLSLTAEF